MGVSYTAVLGVGQRFGEKVDCEEFLRQHGVINKDFQECLDEGADLDEIDLPVQILCLDCYNGEDYFLGFRLRNSNPNDLVRDINEAVESWEKLFPSEEVEIINDVRFS